MKWKTLLQLNIELFQANEDGINAALPKMINGLNLSAVKLRGTQGNLLEMTYTSTYLPQMDDAMLKQLTDFILDVTQRDVFLVAEEIHSLHMFNMAVHGSGDLITTGELRNRYEEWLQSTYEQRGANVCTHCSFNTTCSFKAPARCIYLNEYISKKLAEHNTTEDGKEREYFNAWTCNPNDQESN